MSLYSALYSGVSGLSAEASAMAGVADNITNINTIGYKAVETQFRTLVTDGRSRSNYSAGGVSAAPQALISKQGLLQASSSNTDLAIEGGGFFVTRSGIGENSATAFTRAGSFKPDEAGFLRNTSGYYLQGWRLDASGGYTNTGNLNALEPVRLSELTGTATPTTRIQMRANLSSAQETFGGAYTPGNIAAGSTASHFSRSVDVSDAQGGSHRVTLGFIKTGPNEWQAEAYSDPASAVTAPGGLLASGTVRFNPDGSLDRAGSSPALFNAITPTWTNNAGSVPISLELGTDGGLNGLTQFGSESALITSAVDGGLLGNIASIDITATGKVSAIFEDGTARAVFQLPLATFPNPDGLTRLPGNGYAVSNASGNFAINPPGTFGSGNISAGALEASNVDLAAEFTNMIRFQRAYSASSKIITTVDDMLQEVSNLKR
ncbi:flagellar hook protein FlgE [Sphingomonas mucosissima]|uniref:Flagellar hook protein FlgE n=1 Tax=Sphingomonas mucosissima TaxID=370959 RepID=A0A245ZF21_9SPHN|nr:flagellar hook protein FlgE [Sphingomonas mucosissima]OWK28337.1 flagellar hook protein FlgE [Sphingomonas mucosissima]